MLAIRLQRTGRKGHAQFRLVVQDSRRTPSSGRIVASLGHYDPHSKSIVIEKEKAEQFLKNGAQPSDRVARLLKNEGVTLPKWVAFEAKQTATIRNPEKLRKNRPAEVKTTEPVTEPVKDAVTKSDETTETPDVKASDIITDSTEIKVTDNEIIKK